MKKLIFIILIILTAGIFPIFLNIDNLSYSDFINQQIPFIVETKRMLSSGAPFWSWNTFSGGNFIGQYAFYTLTSPFVWIAIIFPYKYIFVGIILALYLKFCLTGAVTYLLLKKLSFDGRLATIGALMYVFSNFFVSNIYYYHFAEPILMFPVLCLAIENYIRRGKGANLWLALAAFGVVFINYYFAFGTLLLGFIYFLYRSCTTKTFGFAMMWRAVGFTLLGTAMAAFILVPVFCDVMETSRAIPWRGFAVIDTGSQSNLLRYIGRLITRFMSLFFPTVYAKTPPDSLICNANWTSTEAFVMIFGYLAVIIHFFKIRNWLSWLLVILTAVYLIPPLNGIFSMFSSLTYGRWLYGFLLFAIIATLDVVKHNLSVRRLHLLLYILFCVALMATAIIYSRLTNDEPQFTVDSGRWVELTVCLMNFGCLAVWFWFKNRNTHRLLVMVSVCSLANVAAFGYFFATPGNDDSSRPLAAKTYLFDDGAPTLSYRSDDITAFANNAMLTNRPGIYSSHSVYPKSMIPFRTAIDEKPSDPGFNNSYGNRESVAALMSVKNLRVYSDFRDTIPYDPNHITLVNRTPDFAEYTFSRYIPLGFAYDSYVDDEQIFDLIQYADSIDIPALLLANLALKSEDIPAFETILTEGVVSTRADIDSVVAERCKFTALDFEGTSTGFTCTTDFDAPKALFFSVPYDKGFTARIDGVVVPVYQAQLGMSALVVPEGRHSISFAYVPRGLYAGAAVSAAALLALITLTARRRKRA